MTTFATLHRTLLTHPDPLLPPSHSTTPSLTPQIAALQLHPTLEASLHILNNDLPSAHFLARHMQSAPAYEGMYLHGILHRVEGDYENARAWYRDVKESEVFAGVWGKDGGERKALEFIDRIEKLSKMGKKEREEGEEGKALEKESRRELESVLQFCVEKFGTERMVDASSAWVDPDDKIKSQGQDQVSGEAGARTF